MEIKFNAKKLQADIDDVMKKCIEVGKDVVSTAEKIVDALTDKLLEESVKRAPVDEGFLESSHEKEVTKSAMLENIKGSVFIPANSPASDYALYMHEMDYELGERSKVKNASLDVEVGRKYLERALDENQEAFGAFIVMKFRELFNAK